MWFWVHMIVLYWFPFIAILKIFVELLLMMHQYHLMFCKNISLCSYFFFKKETVFQNLFTSWYIVDFKGSETPGNLNLLWHSFCDLFLPQVRTVQSRKDKTPYFIYNIQLKHACAWPTFTFSHLFDFCTVRPADITSRLVGWCHHIHSMWTFSSAQIILSVFCTLEHRFLNLLFKT
jgi:hypothetical protein